jgi:RNA polymerase sigma factor (sigma-70 family)
VEASALPHPVGLGRLSAAGPLLRLRTDDQLVALFRAGHDEAFGIIHDRYRQRLFAYTRQMLGGSRSDAEDVLQDVFLRAYHALRADARPLTLRAWLYRVAHNRCIDNLRRPSPAAADIFDLNRGPQHDPTAAAERREDLRRLVADVRRLPEQQRSALLMREMEGLTYNELADALGVTVPAVKSLLVRARIGLVEAVEARDTACGEIRTDLAAAFDRGVRASGRSRKHLRECTGCRDYRNALRRVEKQLNGLSPGSGPIATLAKILGIGGAGSGAAAGGGAAVAGGGGAALAGAGGGIGAIGGGAAAATASKVAAVVAAAAVVGGGAATVDYQAHRPAQPAAHVAVAPQPSAAAATALAQHAAQASLSGIGPAAARPGRSGADAGPSVALLDPSGPVAATAPEDLPPAYERTTGGLQAPDPAPADPAVPGPAAGAPASAPGTPGIPAATTDGGAGGPVTGGPLTAPGPGAGTAPHPAASGGAGGAGTNGGTASAGPAGAGGTAAPGPSTSATGGPSGQVTTSGDGARVAQGASVADGR